MKRDSFLVLTIVAGLLAAALLMRWNDAHSREPSAQFAEEQLYLNGPAMKRLTLAFNGVAADWYWIRSLQYVGRKIVNYEDTHAGNFDLSKLSSLDLRAIVTRACRCASGDLSFIWELGVWLGRLSTNDKSPVDLSSTDPGNQRTAVAR